MVNMKSELRDKELEISSRLKLSETIKELVIRDLCNYLLDIAQVALPSKQQYNDFRQKVLGKGNDTVRKLSTELLKYHLEYVETTEDLLIFNLAKRNVEKGV